MFGISGRTQKQKGDGLEKLDLEKAKLSRSLDKNIEMMKKIFRSDDTFIVRPFQNRTDRKIRCCAFNINGMTDAKNVADSIIKPIVLWEPSGRISNIADEIMSSVLTAGEVTKERDMKKILSAVLSGDTAISVDGISDVLIANSKGYEKRAINEPATELSMRGPREGFVEPIMQNLAMLRRKIKSNNLKFQFRTFGTETNTTVCLCYIEGCVRKSILDELNRRLDKFQIDGIFDTNYLQESIKDSPYTPFKTIGSTERPDKAAARLLEGRIAVVVDGSPDVLTLPFIFIEYFQSHDDYYINYVYSAISRLLRITGFFLSISMPAIYVALVTHHQEMIPTRLLFAISAARKGVSFPSVIEAFLLIGAFEVLREAGIRTPSNIGQTLSIVGGLVLGQAAVEARMVSAPMLIIVAFTGITALSVPRLIGAVMLTRTILLVMASMFGIYGYAFGMSILMIHLCGLYSFGIPFMSNITSAKNGSKEDVFIRVPWPHMKKQERFLADPPPAENGD